MADLTPQKAGAGYLVKRLLTMTAATGAEFNIASDDPANLLVLVRLTTQSTGKVRVTVNASTSGFTSKGIGAYAFDSTNAAKGQPVYALSGFESARFLDVSTGGKVVEIKVASTSGKVIANTSCKITALQFCASS